MPAPPSPRRRRFAVALAAVALLLVPLSCSACSALRAGHLLQDALQPTEEIASAVSVEEVDVPTRAGDVRVLLARPVADADPLPALVLVHGAVDAGARERRFVAFLRAFAARGMVVAAPDLPSLARFRMDADDPARIADVGRWLADTGRAEDGRVALSGVSVGGSYALVAADDAVLRDHVSTVLAFGAYADLGTLLHGWMTAPSDPHERLFDPLTEGRRLVLLGNADLLVGPADREEVERRLRAILDGREAAGPPLAPDAAEVVAIAESTEPLSMERARTLLERLRDPLVTLSPARGTTPAAPVYLLHGARDPVVPVADMDALAAALRGRGVAVRTHATDLFDHVDARSSPGLLEAWPLLRFLGAFLDDAGL